MEILDLYKKRKPYTVIIDLKGKKTTFKIPTELTVEESERLIESEILIEALSKQETSEDKKEVKAQVNEYIHSLLEYILVLLQHYQPETTMESLKSMVTAPEAIRIFEFFKKQRFLHLLGLDEPAEDDGKAKKKTEKPIDRLEVLRQTMTYLVINGFGLLEIRKLYLDELLSFYNALVYIKEKQGEVKEGTHASLKSQGSNDVESLKSQLFNIQKHG